MKPARTCSALAMAIMVCAGLADPGHAQTAPAAPSVVPSPSESLPLTRDNTQRLTLAVMVNGQGPFDFLVDTGSDRTVISRELAARLGLPPDGWVRIHESAGVDTVETVLIDHLKVGARDIAHIEAPALGEANLGALGMLGVDALKDQHLVMDFKAMRLSTSPSRPEPIDPNTVVVLGHTHYGQLILTNSKIRGVPVLVVLDSGSQVTVGNAALLRLFTGRSLQAKPPRTTVLVTVTGRRQEVEMDDIAEAQVGGVVIRNMPLAFAQLHVFDRFGLARQPALLLGMDVLELCRKVTVDLHRREATFTLN